ncbi:three-Cys-motif partner protein TcmP [Campylobacter fetus subsp. venerealis]|uniref:three-Cys-motif partner protein TcmP n=1 Tax=Campylobacter fetus TaxID=196 RepID=UPI0018E8B88D|nr:three-Cys-motif partner protein TcmP [Campylobacter fetus]QQF51600.1 three-Cys-motif partner protein TcmP [Campylobacter fetus subsp. venerealis]
MTKDMHKESWDEATRTKLDIFEQYIHEWLNIVLSIDANKDIEIYDLFCGSGYDGTKTCKGSPLRILDCLMKRNLKDKKIKIFFNDIEKSKIDELKEIIDKSHEYQKLINKSIEIKYTHVDAKKYEIHSKTYFKFIYLDQYGLEYIMDLEKFIKRGHDILIFISSSFLKRFIEEDGFKEIKNFLCLSKKDFKDKNNYKTHQIITEAYKKKFIKYYICPFTLLKSDNINVNGLIFISNNAKGQEQFLKAAWSIDPLNGEGNIDVDKNYDKVIGSLFHNPNTKTTKLINYENDLKEFLSDFRTNIDIKGFGMNHGFLTKHTKSILEEIKNVLECKYENGSQRGFHLDNRDIKVKIKIKNKINETK